MDKKKILVVDDEKDLRELIKFRLESSGYDIIAACDGPEGLNKAQQEKPDLILLDIMMPGMDGFEAARKLKNNSVTRDIPIIFLTAKGESSSIFKAQDLGAKDYLIKPFEPQELLGVIKKCLA